MGNKVFGAGTWEQALGIKAQVLDQTQQLSLPKFLAVSKRLAHKAKLCSLNLVGLKAKRLEGDSEHRLSGVPHGRQGLPIAPWATVFFSRGAPLLGFILFFLLLPKPLARHPRTHIPLPWGPGKLFCCGHLDYGSVGDALIINCQREEQLVSSTSDFLMSSNTLGIA